MGNEKCLSWDENWKLENNATTEEPTVTPLRWPQFLTWLQHINYKMMTLLRTSIVLLHLLLRIRCRWTKSTQWTIHCCTKHNQSALSLFVRYRPIRKSKNGHGLSLANGSEPDSSIHVNAWKKLRQSWANLSVTHTRRFFPHLKSSSCIRRFV